uniref:Uncharacterized protein n=1 Tax=Oryza sativa subsp. japonica TaxID=39947 RepID=Q7Y0X3_ORYSJ|nr:hypothetical protein [Oryza sativa Japonica Group]
MAPAARRNTAATPPPPPHRTRQEPAMEARGVLVTTTTVLVAGTRVRGDGVGAPPPSEHKELASSLTELIVGPSRPAIADSPLTRPNPPPACRPSSPRQPSDCHGRPSPNEPSSHMRSTACSCRGSPCHPRLDHSLPLPLFSSDQRDGSSPPRSLLFSFSRALPSVMPSRTSRRSASPRQLRLAAADI